jgi:hypothetical protein
MGGSRRSSDVSMLELGYRCQGRGFADRPIFSLFGQRVQYLTSDRLAESSRDVSYYHIPLESAHTILAQTCLGVLLRLDDRIDRNTIKNFPLAKYAADHWIKHARFGDVALYIKAGIESLFDVNRPYFATWLWIYNLERLSIPTMRPEKPEVVPLYYAALFGLRNLTEHLLAEHPEDVHAKGDNEWTPIHAAARYGHTDVFFLLVEHLPNLDVQDRRGCTPLHRASFGGHVDIGQQLLDRGADVNIQDKDGWTALFSAAVDGHLGFARMLLERGAAIDTPDNDGNTPLHQASFYGHLEVVRLLLEHGADLNARNNFGRSPSNIASRIGRREIVQLLSEYSSKL